MWSTFFTLAPLRIDSLFDARFYCRRREFFEEKKTIKKIDVFFVLCICAHFPAFQSTLASFLAPRGLWPARLAKRARAKKQQGRRRFY
jgi:hypothetical protein